MDMRSHPTMGETFRGWVREAIEEREQMNDLTDKRGKTHGAWRQTAGCTQAIETALLIWRTADLKPHHREALHQIAVKLARINCGDPEVADHWLDAAGYAEETAKLCSK